MTKGEWILKSSTIENRKTPKEVFEYSIPNKIGERIEIDFCSLGDVDLNKFDVLQRLKPVGFWPYKR